MHPWVRVLIGARGREARAEQLAQATREITDINPEAHICKAVLSDTERHVPPREFGDLRYIFVDFAHQQSILIRFEPYLHAPPGPSKEVVPDLSIDGSIGVNPLRLYGAVSRGRELNVCRYTHPELVIEFQFLLKKLNVLVKQFHCALV